MNRKSAIFLITLGLVCNAAWADKKAELENVREQLEKLQREYQQTRESRAEAADSLKQSERAISEGGRRLHQLEAERREVQTALKTVSEEAEQASSNIQQRQTRLSAMIRQAYMRGGGDALKLLLNGQDPSQAARDLQYLSYLSRAQTQLINELRQGLNRLAELKQATSEKDRALAEIRQAQIKEQAGLLKEKKARQQVLSKLAGQIKQQRKEIATLKRNEQRLSDLVARLARLAAQPKTPRRATRQSGATGGKPVAVNTLVPEPGRDGTLFSRLKGQLRLPVRGELMNQFGTPREGGGLSWKGLFIRAPEGSEVRAVAQGTVAFAEWLRGFGNLLIVDHGEGYMSLYSNNESLYKQAGDTVKMGEAVASVGNSGGQESPGVYFELRHESRPINPMAWIK